MGLQVKSARANKMYWHLILFAALHQDAGPIAKTCQVKSCAIYVRACALDPLTEFSPRLPARNHESYWVARARRYSRNCAPPLL